MYTWHEWDYEGQHYRAVYDEEHETAGSYAYETEEETKEAEDMEIAKLESGEWVVLGIIVTKPCGGAARPCEHCEACGGAVEVDSLWGIVIENDRAKVEEFARSM